MRAPRRRARAGQPGGEAPRRGGRTDPCPARPRRHGQGRPRGMESRPLGRRAGRRLDLGQGRPRHEGPGGGRARRLRRPREERLAAGGRAPPGADRRRGGRRRPRRSVALRTAPREGQKRLRRQRGRRRSDRTRRPAPLRAQRRREGNLQDPAADPWRGRTRVGSADRRQRPAHAGRLYRLPLRAAAARADPRGGGVARGPPRRAVHRRGGDSRGSRAAARRGAPAG